MRSNNFAFDTYRYHLGNNNKRIRIRFCLLFYSHPGREKKNTIPGQLYDIVIDNFVAFRFDIEKISTLFVPFSENVKKSRHTHTHRRHLQWRTRNSTTSSSACTHIISTDFCFQLADVYCFFLYFVFSNSGRKKTQIIIQNQSFIIDRCLYNTGWATGTGPKINGVFSTHDGNQQVWNSLNSQIMPLSYNYLRQKPKSARSRKCPDKPSRDRLHSGENRT